MVCGWPTGGSLLEAASFVNFVKKQDFGGAYMPIEIEIRILIGTCLLNFRILIGTCLDYRMKDFDCYMPIELCPA